MFEPSEQGKVTQMFCIFLVLFFVFDDIWKFTEFPERVIEICRPSFVENDVLIDVL